ncbi:MAG: general secretion pathway protein GspE [Flavobacteriales bacterium]|nr:general secretion pathway protein GspE [Flavobacteriales bacterium]|tara:strand:+ start:963 stop:2402 length:1440 start_codon:yes stop_codon:yes gene_type:complete
MNEGKHIPLSAEIQQTISTDQAWHYHIVPKSMDEDVFVFYADEDKMDSSLSDELEMIFGKTIKIIPTSTQLIHQTLGKYYRLTYKNKRAETISFDANQSEDFVYKLIAEADDLGCSDIHIEKYEERCRVRLRIDGKLIEKYVIPANDYPALVNKLKIKANLDIAEKRLPQDGRITFTNGGSKFDIRVSLLPTLHGEKIVMRLLSKDATDIDINTLGFDKKQLYDYLEGIKKPNGIILISGPTGSGKTTTLYATLKILNEEKTNLLTIEDPIEYTLEGINQVQLKEDIGLGFASALRSFLRQDPDVIMLGEIRDGETAQMAIRASLTGHLVLSTIHTNSAWGTISRMVDMGVPSYLLANTLTLSVAQRLVRLLCPNCKEQKAFDASLFPNNYKAPRAVEQHFEPVGCEKCFYTGYKGRKAVYEVIPIDYELSECIKNEKFNVREELKTKQINQLMDNAFELFEKGETSIDEVYAMLMSNY